MRRLSLFLSAPLLLILAFSVNTGKAQAQFGPPAGMNFGPGNNSGGSFGPPAGFTPPAGMMGQQGPGDSSSNGTPQGNFSPPSGMMGPGGQSAEIPDEGAIQKMQLKGMFMGIKQGMRGMSQGIKMMKSMLPRLTKQGITPPQELTDAITKAESFIAEVQAIKSADDIPDADAFMDKMSDMADIGATLQEWGPKMGSLMRMGQMIKEADKRIKQMDAGVKRAKTQAAKSKVDLSNIITELDTNVEAAKQALADAKTKTDPDDQQDALDTFFENVQNVFDSMKLIDDLKNIGKAKAGWVAQMKQNDTLLKQLQRKKLDVTEMATKQGELKAKLNELTQALAQKPIDQEAVVGIFDDVKGLQAEFGDLRDQLLGTQSEVPQIKTENFSAPQFNLGAFEQFKKQAPDTSGAADEAPAQ